MGKLVSSNASALNPKDYLLFSEAYIYDVNKVNIPALENIYN